jgi:hypothetical protein
MFHLSVNEYSTSDSTYRGEGYTAHDKDMIKNGRWYRFYIRQDCPEDDSVRFVFDIREITEEERLAQR